MIAIVALYLRFSTTLVNVFLGFAEGIAFSIAD